MPLIQIALTELIEEVQFLAEVFDVLLARRGQFHLDDDLSVGHHRHTHKAPSSFRELLAAGILFFKMIVLQIIFYRNTVFLYLIYAVK